MTHIYIAKTDILKDPLLFRQHCELLPDFRREKLDRMQNEKGRMLSAGAWLLLIRALKKAGVREEELCFELGPYGKPYLSSRPDTHFNISHSGSWLMCALSDSEVGCDVEETRDYDPRLPERFFAPSEAELIASAGNEAEQNFMFFRLWTLKESFIKALGTGLSLPLKDFSMSLEGDKISVKQSAKPGTEFYFKSFSAGGHCCFACCSMSPGFAEAQIIEL